MTYIPEFDDPEVMRLMEARRNQSATLIAAAQNMLRESTEIDLSNLATEILHKYPAAHTFQLLQDQRIGYEGVVFCGYLNDENGNKVEKSFESKAFVEALILGYKFADRKSIVNRIINIREYAARKPSWYTSGS